MLEYRFKKISWDCVNHWEFVMDLNRSGILVLVLKTQNLKVLSSYKCRQAVRFSAAYTHAVSRGNEFPCAFENLTPPLSTISKISIL